MQQYTKKNENASLQTRVYPMNVRLIQQSKINQSNS